MDVIRPPKCKSAPVGCPGFGFDNLDTPCIYLNSWCFKQIMAAAFQFNTNKMRASQPLWGLCCQIVCQVLAMKSHSGAHEFDTFIAKKHQPSKMFSPKVDGRPGMKSGGCPESNSKSGPDRGCAEAGLTGLCVRLPGAEELEKSIQKTRERLSPRITILCIFQAVRLTRTQEVPHARGVARTASQAERSNS